MRFIGTVLFASLFCLSARAELDQIKNIDIAYGFTTSLSGNFVRSDRNPNQWVLQFVDPKEGLHSVPVDAPVQKMLEDLVANPKGPWGFNSKDSQREGDFNSITHGKFSGGLEISVRTDRTIRSVRGHFNGAYGPDGAPLEGEVIRGEIYRSNNGENGREHFVQVKKGIPSDGGGMNVTQRPESEVAAFKEAKENGLKALMEIFGICKKVEEEAGSDQGPDDTDL